MLLFLLHCFLKKPEAGLFVDRWAPQAVVGNLVSASGIREYVRAKLHLQKGVGVFVQEEGMHAFVVSEAEEEGYVVQACLWSGTDVDRPACLRALLEWGDDRNITLLPGPLLGPLME